MGQRKHCGNQQYIELSVTPYKMSIASPILTFRHEISNVETFIEMTLVGLTDDATSIHGAPEGNGANEALQER